MRRDLIALPDNAKVWIYQSNREFTEAEALSIQDKLYDFSMQWQSHGAVVECYAHLFHKYFIVLVADERNHVSGCSIDSSVRFIQNIGNEFNADFFDRLNFLYFEGEEIKRIHSSELSPALKSGKLDRQTLIFNNLVNTKQDFIDSWIKPIEDSWFKKYV